MNMILKLLLSILVAIYFFASPVSAAEEKTASYECVSL
jgi:hypothetical protein